MTNKVMTLVLFRKQLLPTLDYLYRVFLQDASLKEGTEEKSVESFFEIAKEALRWRLHARDWFLHGKQRGSEAILPLKLAHQENVSYEEVLSYVERLSHSYSWSLLPWGVQYTGQMIAFLSSDETVFAKTAEAFQVHHRDLHVSSYTKEELREKRFRGAAFHRSTDFRGQGLWKYGRGSSDSALVLNYASVENPGKLPPNCEMVCEAIGYQFQPILRRWIRVWDEQALLHFVQNDPAVIVTASGLDERFMWLALQDFGDVAEHVNQDTLHFGLKALETASWVYIPMSDDGKLEIYANNDPAVTTSFTQCDEMTHAPYFTHQFFL
jgi:hypothetical protein